VTARADARLEAVPHPSGLRRSAELVKLYRREPVEPEPFYEFLARDTLIQLSPFAEIRDHLLVDIGGGPGYIAEAVRSEGGRCVVVEYDEEELRLHGREPDGAMVADGQMLPLRDGCADLVHCSNVLEHVRRPWDLTAEMVRILRPGGVGYMSFTPWLSPWGGHETSPWHYLGGERAAERFRARNHREAKNLYGTSLFELHLPEVRSWFHGNPDLSVLWDGPRYWPPSWQRVCRVPVVGEVITWNYMIIFRRQP
jgi:SAM-dependent methyltransferase